MIPVMAPEEKALLFPLIELQLTSAQRLQRLPQTMAPPLQSCEAWLITLITNHDGIWSER